MAFCILSVAALSMCVSVAYVRVHRSLSRRACRAARVYPYITRRLCPLLTNYHCNTAVLSQTCLTAGVLRSSRSRKVSLEGARRTGIYTWVTHAALTAERIRSC